MLTTYFHIMCFKSIETLEAMLYIGLSVVLF